ncbi:MAG TPA: PEP-CTERM sorting domain-containing protein, partial [Phycisphaerae bacterium]|nr:PEP-CTERM sorting domain-containing protein [Phycisphaerae bacterium]
MAVLGVLALSGQGALAGTVTWTSASSGDWSTDASWGGAQPISGDLARIGKAVTVTVSQAGEITGTLQVGYDAAVNNSILKIVSGGVLTLDASSYPTARIGASTSTGHKLLMEGGTLNVVGDGTGSLTLSYTNGGSAAIEQSGGTINTGRLRMIYSSTYTMSDGVLNVTDTTNDSIIGQSGGTSTFTQSGGTASFTGLRLAYITAGATGTYNLNNGTLTVNGLLSIRSTNGTGILNMSGGTLNVNTLDGTAAYQGAFNWSGGTLNITSVGRSITNGGGNLSPGGEAAIGTTTFTGDGSYSQNASSTMTFNLLNTGSYDKLIVGGAGVGDATLAGTLKISLLAGYSLANGDTFDVVTADSITDSTTISYAGPGNFTKSIISGGSGQILQLTYIPEPATMALLTGGLPALLWRFRRNRK